MMKWNLLVVIPILLYSGKANCQTDYTNYVNTFIGTDGTGHTFPGPCMPFGMVQPGPDNMDRGWDYTSGYQYKNPTILGFSQTRANGTGINEFGDILMQPFIGNQSDDFAATYLKKTEKANPGYYTVTLSNQIKVELTCTSRVSYHRYTYPEKHAKLLVDLQHGLRFVTDSLVLESTVQIENNTTISGFCHTKNWVERKYFFVIQFNQSFDSTTLLPRRANEAAPRYVLHFELKNRILETKIALSTVSVEGARTNLQAELPGWNFAATVAHARQVWNRYLSRIEIKAERKQKEIFYSSMYRLFIQPSNIADADGKYRGADDRIHTAANAEYYSTLSLWDTYRAAHPLYTLIAPERVNGFINSLIEHSKATGFLPIWTAWGQDNYCMIGNHAIPVIADAYRKGFTGFDANEALKQMIQTTTQNHINSNWTMLNQFGYYPFDQLSNEAVSRTLEHGVDDYSIAVMAGQMGRNEIAAVYYQRAQYYKNLFDDSTKQMRGKNSKGNWRTPFDPLTATSPMNNPGDYTEANAWQYFWTPAQYDVAGMTKLLGGKEQFTAQLDRFFTIQSPSSNKHLGQEALIGQYAHGNEPSHHVAYLYSYSSKPETGKQLITKICNQFYNNTPGGIIGNDDCGQMSAWYIFSTLGFYPVNPASGEYVLGQPQVQDAMVKLQRGKKLVIKNERRNMILLNGRQVRGCTITHQKIAQGAVLNF